MAAAMLPRRPPSVSIASMVFSSTPVSAPFHPACAAPMTRACGSANRIGPQSAALTPIASPDVRVTMASARGRDGGVPSPVGDYGIGRVESGTSERKFPGATPITSAMRRRFSVTCAGIVLRADASIQARINALRDAAFTGEKGVPQPGTAESREDANVMAP